MLKKVFAETFNKPKEFLSEIFVVPESSHTIVRKRTTSVVLFIILQEEPEEEDPQEEPGLLMEWLEDKCAIMKEIPPASDLVGKTRAVGRLFAGSWRNIHGTIRR